MSNLNGVLLKNIGIVFYILACAVSVNATVSSTVVKRNSVEDIFIWKMSDELKLSAADEKKFSEIHKTLNRKKIEIQNKINEISYFIKQEPTLDKSRIKKAINEYRKTLNQYNYLSTEEVNKMIDLLGERKFLEYLSIKQDINQKLKSLVIGDDLQKNHVKPLPPPKIIEEK